jgi:FkbM family methyltransferase
LRNHEPELAILSALVDEELLALDIGANRALYTIRLRGLTRKVHAFEPVPHLAARLRAAFPDVAVHEVALSSQGGSATLRLPGSNTSWATIEPGNTLEKAKGGVHGIEVTAMRLDDIELEKVGFVKIDVEGHELAVLEGARALLRRDRPVLLIELEERHTQNALRNAVAALEPLDYRGYFLDGDRLRPVAAFDAAVDQDQARVSEHGKQGRYLNNFVFIPEQRTRTVFAHLRELGLRVEQ